MPGRANPGVYLDAGGPDATLWAYVLLSVFFCFLAAGLSGDNCVVPFLLEMLFFRAKSICLRASTEADDTLAIQSPILIRRFLVSINSMLVVSVVCAQILIASLISIASLACFW